MAPKDTRSIWQTMRTLSAHYGWFSTCAVLDILGHRDRRTVEAYLIFLKREYVIERADGDRANPRAAIRYRIVRDGEAPPLPLGGKAQLDERRQAIWTAMRSLRQFSPAELALAASTETIAAGGAVKPYLTLLADAGYVDRLDQTTYRLRRARDTGPRAPIVMQADGTLFDLNLMRAVNVTAQPAVNHTGRAA